MITFVKKFKVEKMCVLNSELNLLVEKVISGESITYEEAVALPLTGSIDELCVASARITGHRCSKDFE